MNGVIKPRRRKNVDRDARIFRQVNRWRDVESGRQNPVEWARGLVQAMMED